MKRTLLILLVCISFLIFAKSGQAQDTAPLGPMRLENGRPAFGPISDVYQLHYLKVSDTQPAQYVWLFHKLAEPPANATESDESIFRSLNSPDLLSFIAHLPPGVRIAHFPTMPPSHTQPQIIFPLHTQPQKMLPSRPQAQVVGSNEPGLLDFISLCRRSKIDFIFGTAF